MKIWLVVLRNQIPNVGRTAPKEKPQLWGDKGRFENKRDKDTERRVRGYFRRRDRCHGTGGPEEKDGGGEEGKASKGTGAGEKG